VLVWCGVFARHVVSMLDASGVKWWRLEDRPESSCWFAHTRMTTTERALNFYERATTSD